MAEIVSESYVGMPGQIEVAICVDCHDIAANGNDNHQEYCEGSECLQCEAFSDPVNADYILIAGEGEGRFSWWACDYCGSRLGGQRWDTVMLPR